MAREGGCPGPGPRRGEAQEPPRRRHRPLDGAWGQGLDQEELQRFAGTLGELQWLLLVLGAWYYLVPGGGLEGRPLVGLGLAAYGVFALAFRYHPGARHPGPWRLAVETWAMLAFVSWLVWHSGRAESPLLGLYLVVFVAAALTLGRRVAFMELLLAACVYLYMLLGQQAGPLAGETWVRVFVTFAPFLLAAYLTAQLAEHLHGARRRLQALSETDALTGLPNFRAFMAALRRECARQARYGQPFALLMVDADGLKQVNDRLGHAAGNRYIVETARVLGGQLRGSDLLARFGGDEFALLLPATAAEQALLVAERLRRAVAARELVLEGEGTGGGRAERVRLQVSIG
ncbi:MAG: GGDEF domain-containing protein, partial [Gammaproteobacteria bacterium]